MFSVSFEALHLINLKNDFRKKGYVVIKNVFSENEINNFKSNMLKEKYFDPETNASPEISIDDEFGYLLYDERIAKILKLLELENLQYFGAGTLVGNRTTNRIGWRRLHVDTRGHKKNPFGKTFYDPAKKDWPIIDLFIYLEDFKKYSGCLKVIEGSHKKFLPTIGNFLKIFFNISKNYKFDGTYSFKSIPFFHLFNMKNLRTEPGDIVIFNHAIHHSPNSCILKKFPNLVLPVFLENILYKYFPNIFQNFSQFRRIISIPYGQKSEELEIFIKSRVKWLSKKILQSRFYKDINFRKRIEDKNIGVNLNLNKYFEDQELLSKKTFENDSIY